MTARVLVSDGISETAVEIFKRRGIDVTYEPQLGADKTALQSAIGSFDGLAVRSATKVTAKLMEQAVRLRVIGRAGIGVDNIDLAAATAWHAAISARRLWVVMAPKGSSRAPSILSAHRSPDAPRAQHLRARRRRAWSG